MTKTAQTRLLYLTDLRAHRHGCDDLSGITWERAAHGPYNKSVGFLPRKVELVDVAQMLLAAVRRGTPA